MRRILRRGGPVRPLFYHASFAFGLIALLWFAGTALWECGNQPDNPAMLFHIPWYSWVGLVVGMFLYIVGRRNL